MSDFTRNKDSAWSVRPYTPRTVRASTDSGQSWREGSRNTGRPTPTSTITSGPNSFREDSQSYLMMGSSDSFAQEDGNNSSPRWTDVLGVRVRPSMVKFENTFENQTYTETVSIQNISNASVIVRIHNPRAWSFRVAALDRGYLLAPGLKIIRYIHYTCTKTGMVHSTLPIYVNEELFQLPLEACKGQAFVEIIPTTIKFGRVDIGCKPVERKIQIKNVSYCATKFLIDIGNNALDLHVWPMKGWIRPHSSVAVTVQLLALREGTQKSELWITTDLCQTRVHLEVEACRRNLLVIHPNTISDFTLIDFPITVYGCHSYQTVIVHNMAASSSAFVVLVDYGSKGQVVSVRCREIIQQPFIEAKLKGYHHAKMFDIEPVEGRIRPFEERIFTFWFKPIAEKQTENAEICNQRGNITGNPNDVNDYLCAIRIKRIQVDDFSMGDQAVTQTPNTFKRPVPTASPTNSNLDVGLDEDKEGVAREPLMDVTALDEISVLLYLYGEAEVASVSALPNALHFPNSLVGTTIFRVIQLSNNTNQMLAFHYSKIPFFKVIPDFKKLGPKSKFDVTVKFCPTNMGVLKRNLIFEILAQENATDKQDFRVVNQVVVRITGDVILPKIVPEPKFNPGITPLITNEVGFLTDEVTFASQVEKPRAAVMAVAGRGRPWHRTDAVVAFPNDRPVSLRPHANDTTARTIYKGLARYVAPIERSYTYTLEELLKKKANDEIFLNYIRGTAAMSVSNKVRCCNRWKREKYKPDPPVTLFEKKEEIFPREVFVPLTFVQLYRIRVSPPLIHFGSVTTSKCCTQMLCIENENDFNISAQIMPLTIGITAEISENFIIYRNTDAKIMLTFQREVLGRYSGTITCIINGYHSFDIAVVAEVVHRSLTISPETVELKIPDVPFASTFVPIAIHNPLNIPVIFSWDIPEESPIKIEPVTGVALKRGTVWCVVFFEPDSPNFKLHQIKLMVEDTVCFKLKTGVVLPKSNVYAFEPVVNVGNIPLNLKTVRRFHIFNPDFSDAMFVVLNKEPTTGVKVIPATGTIKAKSCRTLALEITIETEKLLDFVVFINLQNSVTIEIRVIGTVVYPEVEVTPHYINLHRVPCNSVTRTQLMAENKSKAIAQVSFDFEEYPQFKVSLSKHQYDPGLTSRGFSLEPGATQKFYLHFIPKDLASYDFYLPIFINLLKYRRFTSERDMELQGKILKGVSAESRRRGTSATNRGLISHLVLVDVSVLKAAFVFSDMELSFSFTNETKSFTVTSSLDQPVGVVIRPDDSSANFDYKVENGEAVKDRSSFKMTLYPGDSITVLVTFTANRPGTSATDVNVLLAMEDQSTAVYNTVHLTGTIPPFCTITPTAKEIYFPQVPLNVDASFIFHLNISHHQDKMTVISSDMAHPYVNLFDVEYPNGNTVSGVVDCTLAMSFKGNIDGYCTVLLIATADNCLVTTHAYMKTNAPNIPRLVNGLLDEIIDRPTEVSVDKAYGPNLHQTRRTSFSSTTGSSRSSYSLKTICGTTSSPKVKKSLLMNFSKASSANADAEKEQQNRSHSDINLELNQDENEENILPKVSRTTGQISKEDEELVFPMFPKEHSFSEYSIYMIKTKEAIQQYIYEQVFCCSYSPFLGSYSFSMFFQPSNKKDYSTSSPVPIKNVFDALERICGRRIRRFFTPTDKIPEEVTAKAVFIHNIYRQLLDFMEAQGALMAHVEPKYLMSYDDYCAYQKAIPLTTTDRGRELLTTGSQISYNNTLLPTDLIPVEIFESISHQCWLDFALQMFKTLILGPAVGIAYYDNHENAKLNNVGINDKDNRRHIYGKAEETLLTWLTHQFNTQRTVVWPNKTPSARTITNFDSDLEDGLVLTAATAAYCPYLNQIHFQDMSLCPTTISQAYHNNTCLAMAWDSIKLGFSITPRDFVNPNTIKMLLLVTHLYKILPTYKPETTIMFKATLNSSESQIIMLENEEEMTITYHIEILPHSANFFLEDCQNTLALKRKSKSQVTVRYLARNANKAEAILLLCGACMPPKFGRNYVFKLEGSPIKLPVSSSFNILSPQSITLNTEITVESPHTLDFKAEDSYTYDLWIAFTEPQPGNLNAVSWAKERKRKIPRRVFFTTNTLVVTQSKKKNGSGTLPCQVCCFSQLVFHFWLIFRNPDIGDFIVKLTVTPRKPEPVMNIVVNVDEEAKCSCMNERNLNCNRSMTVQIPCRNLELWASLRTMFELTTSPAEKEFWGTYIESNIGFRLLQWMLEDKKEKFNEELEALFKKSKNFKVSCTSKSVTCVPTVHIPDVRSKSTLPVQIHVDEAATSHSTVLHLSSVDGVEMRSYVLRVAINGRK